MDQFKFQVNVDKATPACSADCPNLRIDIMEVDSVTNDRKGLRMLRRFRCVSDDYCRRLYAAFEKERSGKE